MKEYEAIPRIKLTRRMPMIIRVDGKAFHTYTRGFKRPWDERLMSGMNAIAKSLMEEVQGAKLAYVQSDEVSLLVTDYDNLATDAWFDKNVQKVSSIAASVATASFNQSMTNTWVNEGGDNPFKFALFDARCFVLPEKEIANYFIWRQQDATRNSIMSLAQANFSHKELHGVNTDQAQELLHQTHGINWNDCKTWHKRGWCAIRKTEVTKMPNAGHPDHEEVTRTVIESDWDIPIFTQNREYIEKLLPC